MKIYYSGEKLDLNEACTLIEEENKTLGKVVITNFRFSFMIDNISNAKKMKYLNFPLFFIKRYK